MVGGCFVVVGGDGWWKTRTWLGREERRGLTELEAGESASGLKRNVFTSSGHETRWLAVPTETAEPFDREERWSGGPS